jgi:hypothetical protein
MSKICKNMHIKYAKICRNMQHPPENMQKYAEVHILYYSAYICTPHFADVQIQQMLW